MRHMYYCAKLLHVYTVLNYYYQMCHLFLPMMTSHILHQSKILLMIMCTYLNWEAKFKYEHIYLIYKKEELLIRHYLSVMFWITRYNSYALYKRVLLLLLLLLLYKCYMAKHHYIKYMYADKLHCYLEACNVVIQWSNLEEY
jgi:hypothetical protein